MSFSINLNSVDGTKVVAGITTQIIYNFDWSSTPKHSGGYRVGMTFCSQMFNTRTFDFSFNDIYANADLGIIDSYTPIDLYTGTQYNRLLGVVKFDKKFMARARQHISTWPQPTVSIITTVAVPANSDTAAHTLDATTVRPDGLDYSPTSQTVYSSYKDNPPVYITSKPTNNQFMVSLLDYTGSLHSAPETANTDYSMIILFEAV